jgi:Na+/proline symporter
MSDIAFQFSPLSLAVIALVLGSPGSAGGAIVGALLWRGHRIWGAVLGAIAGFGLWLVGWYYIKDMI